MTWYGGSLRPGDIVLDGDPAPPSLKGHSPQFWTNVRCGQTAGWTKMPLSMEVGLVPGDCVRWKLSSPPQKKGCRSSAFPKGAKPQFSAHVYCGQTVAWMKTPLGTEVDPSPGHIGLDGYLGTGTCLRGTAAPSFWPMSIVATVAHLSYC